ncbi:MAG: hypothetical protein ACXVHX_17085 [Solirubrobacteraceae bacterium]
MREEELRLKVEGLPGGLAIWHAGPRALPETLQVLALRRLMDDLRRERAQMESPGSQVDAEPRHARDDRLSHACMSLVAWHSMFGQLVESLVPARPGRSRKSRASSVRRPSLRDAEAAVDLAEAWEALDTFRVGLASGDLAVEKWTGRHVYVTNRRLAAVEALDIALAQVTVLDPPTSRVDFSPVEAWFRRNKGRPEAVNELPVSVRRVAWQDALSLLEVQGTTVPLSTDLGGLSLEEARACYAVLIGQLRLNLMCAAALGAPQGILWGIKPSALLRLLATFVEERAAQAFIEVYTYTAKRSPLSAPLIPWRDMLLIPWELVSPVAFERTLLRGAQADPVRSGPLGNVAGARAVRWGERLGSVPGCLVANEVPVRGGGRSIGDLDTVAWDPAERLMMVIETKWPVDAATLNESEKVDAFIARGRGQLNRVRAAVADGSGVVRWPAGWDVPVDTEIRWWVGSAQQLESRPALEATDIKSTSLRLVEQLLPRPSLRSLLDALDEFPMPREGIEYHLVPSTVTVNDVVVHFDRLALEDLPIPPPDRRLRNGWT